jgi:preprotein translocase subunit SecD
VIVFMFVTYGLFGVFANIAVAINVAMIFGVLSLLSATLTLPGIAGIVLTVGIAVDSNVLIYERIREEVRGGRTAINAIDAGFKRALPPFSIPISPPSSPPRCCSISAPGRCAASP